MNTGQIVKSRSTNRNAVIPNSVAQSKDLSLAEKGLLLYLLSLPADWVILKSNLHYLTNEKKGTIDTVFRGLQEKGFIVSAKIVNEKGQFKGWNHVVYDEPILSEINTDLPQQKPSSTNPEFGQSTPIQSNNLIGLKSINNNYKVDSENFEKSQGKTILDTLEAERKKTIEYAAELAAPRPTVEQLTADLAQNRATLEVVCLHNKISMAVVLAAVKIFGEQVSAKGDTHDRKSFYSYFYNWAAKPNNIEKVKTMMASIENPAKPKYKEVPKHILDQMLNGNNNRD